MKKILFGFIALQALSAATTQSFTGFYAGGTLGTEARGTQYDFVSSGSKLQYNKNKVGAAFGIFSGYGRLINHSFYLGGEISIYGTTANQAKNLVDQYSATDVRVKYDRGAVFGIAVRLGHVLDENTLVYAKLGKELSKDTINVTDPSGAKTVKIAKIISAFAPGFGFEHKFGRIIGGIQYSYSIGRKAGKTVDKGSAKLNVQRKSHQVMFRASYQF